MPLIFVPATGPSNAKLAIIGEAPGGEEERLLTPFVGPTGKIVDSILGELGINRNEVYFTNVVKVRPPGNNLKELHHLGVSIETYLPQLHEEVRQLNPNAILALGNTALEACTGFKGIEKYRGSILPCIFHQTKVIPSIHPASLLHAEADGKLRSWKDITFIKWDFARAVRHSAFPDYNPPGRNLVVCRNALQLDRFFRTYEDTNLFPYVAVDIETFKTIPICISFAFSKDNAISVPLFNFQSEQNKQGMTRSDIIECWSLISDILANPELMKIGQNFKFDQRLLQDCVNDTVNFGFKVNSFFFDTMLAFRTLFPELPSSLQFSTSVLTEEPYYKDEGKEYNPKKDKFDRLLLYNAKDAAVTFEVFEEECKELEKRNLTEFFYSTVMPLHDFYSRVERRGIKRDNFQKTFLEEKYKDKRKNLQEELDEITKDYQDKPLNVSSPKQVGILLYLLMKLPMRKSTDEKTLDALMRNAVKDLRKKRAIELILEIRKVRKTIGTYIEHEVDFRGRTLTSVRIALETGRTSNGVLDPPVTTRNFGLAFQTITKHGNVGQDLRIMFVPDENHVLLEPDLSGAEARVVAILADDAKLLKIFKYNLDLHRITKGWLDDVCPDNLLNQFFLEEGEINLQILRKEINDFLKSIINDEQRQEGKKYRHAGHYDMGKREASRQTGQSEWKSGKNLEKFHATNPNIRNVFHKGIIEALGLNNRVLTSPNGRQRQFLNRWGSELFKEAYAQIPQSTVSDQTKKAARACELRAPYIQILMESHDSFLSQVPLAVGEQFPMKYVDRSVQIMTEELESPIDFRNCSLSRGELIIPCEIKLGDKNWESMERIK
jgi:uracil-DNA glycosylase